MNKVVAFLDILGFGNHICNDINDALGLLADFETIIEDKITDKLLHPPQSYKNDELKKLAIQNYVDSFEYFIPCSDSLFIQSSSPDIFLKQLSNFLLDCFHLSSHAYSYPEDPANPAKVTIREIGQKGVESKACNWLPLLFRGGISYGEFRVFDVNSVINSEIKKVKNMAGPTLVKAVKELEPLGKGPRLFCDIDFVSQLCDETKKYCKKIQGDHYEILWPAFYYIESNGIESEINKIDGLIRPIVNLYKAYKGLPFGDHYHEFLKLVITSSSRYFEIRNRKESANDKILTYLKSVDLQDFDIEL